jgi:FkbM family methyltransferase
MHLYQVKKFLLSPYLAIQRHRYGPPDNIAFKILDRMDFSGPIFRFFEDSSVEDIQTKADLTPDSLVWDVGGFNGEWAEKISEKYSCHIWIFEPNPNMQQPLNRRFAGNNKIKIFPVALGDSHKTLRFFLRGAGSSVFNEEVVLDEQAIDVEQKDALEIFEDNGSPDISLLKVNIEGGEYDLMPYLIKSGITKKCRNIRIQFHEWIPGSYRGRREIVKALNKHHSTDWSYKFVWESWVKPKG